MAVQINILFQKQGLLEQRGNKPPSISQIQTRVLPSDPQLLKCHPASVCISANLSTATTTTVGTKRPPEALIVPQSVIWFLKNISLPALEGNIFKTSLRLLGWTSVFSTTGLYCWISVFWGFLVCFLFLCHKLLHTLSRPPAKPNETQTQPPRLRTT